MRRIILLMYFILIHLNASAIYFRHIGIEDGLSQLSVMSIYQDEIGRMWFGTLEGINMYNGKDITVFKSNYTQNANSSFLLGNDNRHITGDNKGHIFFQSDYSLVQFDICTQSFSFLRQGGVSCLNYTNNQLYYSCRDSVYHWDMATSSSQLSFSIGIPSLQIQKIVSDSNQNIWIGSHTGLYKREKETGDIICILQNQDIYDIFEDSKNRLWIATYNAGIFLITSGGIENFTHDPLNTNSISHNQARCFIEDNYGVIWVGTFTGLNKFNPETRQFRTFRRQLIPGSLKHSSIFSLYKDNQGTVWVGTYYGGVHYFNPETDLFTFYSDNPQRQDCLSYPFVGNMVEDQNGNIWICTEGGGLNFFNRKTQTFKHYMADGSPTSIAHNNLKSICYSQEHQKLFIGTHTGGLTAFDLLKNQFDNISRTSPSYPPSGGAMVVNDVSLYNKDTLLFTTQSGLYKMDILSSIITPFYEKGENITGSGIYVDSHKNVWITAGRIVKKIRLHEPVKNVQFYTNQKGLGNFSIVKVFEDRKGRIYFGTLGSGLYQYDPVSDYFKAFLEENNSLQSNYCYNIQQSIQGYLLISGNKGLTFLDPENGFIKTVDLSTVLPIEGINNGCGLLVCKNGEIFAGGTNGFTTFFEQELFNPTKNYKLFFTDLYINNEKINPNDNTSILSKTISLTQDIYLKHNQNNISLGYSTNNYVSLLRKRIYEYKLEGFENKWYRTENQEITYTNLNPGNYILHIREVADNYFQQQTISLTLTISSPWYATPFAYLLYLIITLTLILSFYRFKRNQLLLETSLEIERKEKEKIEELNHAKLQFFSNISHEFRTPLTLIISQMEILLQSSNIAPTIYNKLLKVYKNTYHLRNLISELLDFRKLEQGHVKLKVYEQDIIPFLKEIYYSFFEYAEAQHVSYKFTAPDTPVMCWYDPKQLQKVFFNLLSNSFKYSSVSASIEMIIEEKEDLIAVKVIDNGIGIKPEEINKIFDRFYQAEDSGTYHKTPSTGIGLSLCKSIVELHQGHIQVESTPGYGSIFIINLPKGNSHFKEEELIFKEKSEILPDIPIEANNKLLAEMLDEKENILLTEEGEKRYKLLIVEDNEELLHILHSLFTPLYHVFTAPNGQEGLELTRKEMPDIIISDIMMPVMTGSELCLKIKNDPELCHIPIILLTAMNSIEQNIEGLKRGADDYINKPFSSKILVARCNNLIRNRILIQKKFGQQEIPDTHTLANNPIDQKFMDNVTGIIEKNIDNQEFDMNNLAKELGLSRSSLYSKFKILTGMTPNEFVLTWKLKKAAYLIKNNPELQIIEISDQLGFGSARYFTRCFKAHFNITPAEYRKNT